MTSTELENYASALPNIGTPIAENGDKRALIPGGSNTSDLQASIAFGLPALMSEPLDDDGIPVPRQDLNGIYNLLSKITHYLMAGGKIPYSANESTAIGGYPQGAEVVYEGRNYKSLADSNTALPTDATKWACIDYLPLAGGTMTGAITWGSTSLSSPSNGVLQFGGKNIVRSVNGIYAGTDGNIAESRTTIFENPSGQGDGDITLSQSWRNFRYLIVTGSDDDKGYLSSHIVDVDSLKYAVDNGRRFMLFYNNECFWKILATSSGTTDTKFKVAAAGQNCVLFRIVGIK